MGIDQDPKFVLAAGTAFPGIALIVTSLRFYVRRRHRAGYGPDDWFSLLALIFLVALGTIIIIGVNERAFGVPDNSTNFLPLTDKLAYSFLPLQVISVGCAKLSFVYFYRRVFATGLTKYIYNVFSKITLALLITLYVWMIAMIFAYLFSCGKHVSAQWSGVHEKCEDPVASTAAAISDFVTDVIVFIVPIPMICRLHMTLAGKVSLLIIFGFGSLSLAASCVRLVVFYLPREASTNPNLKSSMVTNNDGEKGVWLALEAGTAVIACSLPMVYTLVAKLLDQSASRGIEEPMPLRPLTLPDTENFHSQPEDTPDGSESTVTENVTKPPDLERN